MLFQNNATRISVKIIHHLPGRIRINMPGLKDNRITAVILSNTLLQLPGVLTARVNTKTTTALIIYNPDKISPGSILANIIAYKDSIDVNCAATCEKLIDQQQMVPWPQVDAAKVVDLLKTDPLRGLSNAEAAIRLTIAGENRLFAPEPPDFLTRIFAQMKDFLVQTLLGSSLICALMGEAVDAIAIMLIIIINSVLGAAQEGKAEQALNALKDMAAPSAKVIRDGGVKLLEASQLVPGDIVVLEPGDGVPADIRLIDAINIKVEESALTGESHPVAKSAGAMSDCVTLIDCDNILFMGTDVVKGRAKGVVIATGLQTELGKISSMLNEHQVEQTPLQHNMYKVGQSVLKASIAASVAVAILGILRGGSPGQMFLTAVSLAVAAIPEGLPAIVTIAMASGVHKMAQKNAIVKKISSVETIGGTTIICTDKTGTLTKNEQTIKMVYCAADESWHASGSGYNPEDGCFSAADKNLRGDNLRFTLLGASLCCNAKLEPRYESGVKTWDIKGEPLEAAILSAARKAGISDEILGQFHRIYEEPFDSVQRRMHVVCRHENNELLMFVKGASDTVLPRCNSYRSGKNNFPLTEGVIAKIYHSVDTMTSKAMRVLAIACKTVPKGEVNGYTDDTELTLLGLVGMIDPPRPEVPAAIRKCLATGIGIKMITGDHPNTAMAIARELGMEGIRERVITGQQLESMGDAEATEAVLNNSVFARILPEHKLKIVRLLKGRGDTVIMIGDGVNDAPAVKEATVGVAMGLKGTDVTRHAADLILMDDNFSTVVVAIEQGRGIYRNIKKSVRYLLATNAGEVGLTFLSVASGLPLPLLPIQLLWLNLLGDGLPAVALGVDSIQTGLSRQTAQGSDFFDRDYKAKIIRRGITMSISGFGTYWLGLTLFGLPVARTMTLTSITLGQFLHALEIRREKESPGKGQNSFLNISLLVSAALLMTTIYWPPARRIFGTTFMNWRSMCIALTGAAFGSALDKLLEPVHRSLIEPKAKEPVYGCKNVEQ